MAPVRGKTPKELVRTKYPTAYLYDDGKEVKIYFKGPVTDTCPNCGQSRVNIITLASAKNAKEAWRQAADTLGLHGSWADL